MAAFQPTAAFNLQKKFSPGPWQRVQLCCKAYEKEQVMVVGKGFA